MQRKTKRRLAAVALIAAVAAVGGSAFTNTVDGVAPQVTAGFASTNVQGARALDVQYNYSVNKEYLDNIKMILQGDTTGSSVRIGFNHQAPIALCQLDPQGEDIIDEWGTRLQTSYVCYVNTPVVSIFSTEVTVIDNDPLPGV